MSRKARLIVVLLAAMGTAAALAGSAPKKELRVVFIAYENPDQLIEDVKPVADYLKRAVNMEVKTFVATDYAGVVEALKARRADMGFMGPLQYCMARQQAGAVPILGELYNGKPSYVSRIFVRRDSGLKKIADLRGKTIAFVDPISSSGYMYPLEIFRRAGLIQSADEAQQFFRKVLFAGGDEQAIRAVLNRFVDAAGIGQYSINLLRPEERDEVMSLAQSIPLPSHCVVVRQGMDPKLSAALQNSLLALNKGADRKLLKNLYNVDGYVKVTHRDYEEVEKIARDFGFLKGG